MTLKTYFISHKEGNLMMRMLRRLKFLFKFKKSVPFLKEFFKTNEVKRSKKLVAVLLILGYFIFPFDLIPDVFLVLGIVDDFAIAGLILQQLVKMAPESMKEKYQLPK